MDWNNRSVGDILPTYRWMIENEGENSLKADFDVADAWYGGKFCQALRKYGKRQSFPDSDVQRRSSGGRKKQYLQLLRNPIQSVFILIR